MDDGIALLRGILEEPACNTARLVYADWLEENGNAPWARFIRHQTWSPVSPCRNAPLTALIDLEPFVGVQPHQYVTNTSGSSGATVAYPNGMAFCFRRGFVDELHLPCAAFVAPGFAARVFSTLPITSVELTDREVRTNCAWYRGGPGADDRNCLPDELFDAWLRLPPGEPTWRHVNRSWMFFRDAGDAHKTLSTLCVAHGRKLAGLSPIIHAERQK